MKLIEITEKMKATSAIGLLSSIKNGKFTQDGSRLVIKTKFSCSFKDLTSLVGCPGIIKDDFSCYHNILTSLIGGPKKVEGGYFCYENKLTSLEGCPEEIGGRFSIFQNKLTSLKDVHKYLKKMNGAFYANENPIKSHVLGLLKIQGCDMVILDNTQVQNILRKYLPLGDLFDCQEELIEAGFEEYAQL